MRSATSPRPEVLLVLGGARSGKSTFAQEEARRRGGDNVLYVATAETCDGEMRRRIALHRENRPASWETLEGPPQELASALWGRRGVILLDCLTVWLSRLFLALSDAESEDEIRWEQEETGILSAVERLIRSPDSGALLVVVSNEVGWGLVPPTLLGRRFRDLQGRANQRVGALADHVALVVAGIPLWIKGGPRP